MNINLAINEGSKILKRKFIPNPILDAEILMAKQSTKIEIIFYLTLVILYQKI